MLKHGLWPCIPDQLFGSAQVRHIHIFICRGICSGIIDLPSLKYVHYHFNNFPLILCQADLTAAAFHVSVSNHPRYEIFFVTCLESSSTELLEIFEIFLPGEKKNENVQVKAAASCH